jgi:hypothetical protein
MWKLKKSVRFEALENLDENENISKAWEGSEYKKLTWHIAGL